MQNDLGKNLLSSIIIHNKYARYLPDKQRRETWEEICDRYQGMMTKKFPELSRNIIRAAQLVREKKILPSMRGLQFAGKAIEDKNERIYNCSYCPLDSIESFSEGYFLLLAGCGFGYSVQQRHVSKLPTLKAPNDTIYYQIEDSIEGWADSVKILLEAYLEGGPRPVFDYNLIRPKGSKLSATGGKAPGPDPLKRCLERIDLLLHVSQIAGFKTLSPFECHRIMCIIAESVLSGGVRRSSLISLFDKEDDRMLTCKSGNWWIDCPELRMANNSVVLHRETTTKEEFDTIFKRIEESNAGEPGIFWTNDYDLGTNPCCFTGDTKILTPQGYMEIRHLLGEGELLNKDGKICNSLIWSNGVKSIIELTLSNKKKIKCTPDHRLMLTNESEIQAKDSKKLRLMPYFQINKEISEFTKYGFIQGDGALGRLNSIEHKGLEIYIGRDDEDIFELFDIEKIKGKTNYYTRGFNEILKALKFDSRDLTERTLPRTFMEWSKEDRAMFLKGMFSANGSVTKKTRVSYKTSSKQLAEDLVNQLEFLGISSYITTNKEKEIKFSNGNYTCKESYDVNICKHDSLITFASKIGFVHKYKQQSLEQLIKDKAPMVISISKLEDQEVFDFSLDDKTHWGVVEGIIAHNCEISLRPYTFCNLNEINASNIESLDDLLNRCQYAALLGTLQASFTDFKYLRPIWKQSTDEDALIGVGITGIASNKIDKAWLAEASYSVKQWNEYYAKQIGINSAARCTTVKPAGTTSSLLGSSSGIHGWHDEYYIRRMRILKTEALYTYLLINNPEILEDDIMDPQNTAIISFPIKATVGGSLRSESMLDLLERIKTYNIEWIHEGHRSGLNYNNVSATVTVPNKISNFPNEDSLRSVVCSRSGWEILREWMWSNKEFYSGISILPEDLGTYQQTPFESITKEKYEELVKVIKNIDLSKVVEMDDNTNRQGEQACGANGCEII